MKYTLVGFPDLLAKAFAIGVESAAFPDRFRVASWIIDCPGYNGGTAPDLRRLPCYALTGAQNA